MATSSSAVAKSTIAAVERARSEMNALKEQLSEQFQTNPSQRLPPHIGQLQAQIAQSEAMVAKAESSVKRIRNVGRVPPRPNSAVPQSLRAKRALAVLTASSVSPTPPVVGGRVANSSVGQADHCGTDAQNPVWLREDVLDDVLAAARAESGLSITRRSALHVVLTCERVFVASLWLQVSRRGGNSDGEACLLLDGVTVRAVAEGTAHAWEVSEHDLFKILSERAQAAARFFWARHGATADALRALVRWMAAHRTLFSATYEHRRLAFDAARGIYLPACIRPFAAPSMTLFPRGSIPARHASSSSSAGAGGGTATHAGSSSRQGSALPSGPTVNGTDGHAASKPQRSANA